MNKLVLLLVALLFAVAASANECDAVNCPIGTRCVEEPKMCITTPCPQYACIAIRRNPCRYNPCSAGEICLPEPKFCITTPCPQYRCLTAEEYICETADCPEGTTCRAEAKQCITTPCPQYTCEAPCDKACTKIYQPVCGTDGVTYSNQCMLSVAACKDDSIAFAYEGECATPVDPCDRVCPMLYAPVCGTDGNTYSNQCMLSVAACKDDSIAFAYEGECVVDYCAGNTCTASQICLADPKMCITTPCPQYQCIEASLCGLMCPMLYAPVCGTDGNTYSNACMLRNAACELKKVINVAHDGEC